MTDAITQIAANSKPSDGDIWKLMYDGSWPPSIYNTPLPVWNEPEPTDLRAEFSNLWGQMLYRLLPATGAVSKASILARPLTEGEGAPYRVWHDKVNDHLCQKYDEYRTQITGRTGHVKHAVWRVLKVLSGRHRAGGGKT